MILISLIVFFIVVNIYNTYTDKMDTALNYVGLAATTGLSTYVLAQLLSAGSANRQLYHGMTTGAKAIGKAAPIVYHKAEDVAKTLYNDAKDLVHQPFQVLSNPLTMAAVGIGGIAVIYNLTKF